MGMRPYLPLLVFAWAPFAGAQAKYHVVDLYNDIHEGHIRALDVNDNGQVLLWNESDESYLWHGSAQLDTIKYQNEGTRGKGLNNFGEVCGTTVVNQAAQGFKYTHSGGFLFLGPCLNYLSTETANINDNSDVVGFATSDGKPHPVKWSPSTGWSDLSGPPPLDKGGFLDINGSGVISGSYRAPSDNLIHTICYTPGVGIEDLGMPQGMNSWQGDRINAAGVIGGSMNRIGDAAQIGFLLSPNGALTQLLDPAQQFNNSDVAGLSKDGTAVGYINRPAQYGGLGGYVYNAAYGMVDIDTLKDEASSAYRIGVCSGISDHTGMIVAEAKLDGVSRQVLLVPVVPEPPSWLLLTGTLAIVAARRRKTRRARMSPRQPSGSSVQD